MALSPCLGAVDEAGRELVQHGRVPFPVACYHDDLNAFSVPWHWHEELEVLIVTEGTVLAAAGAEKFTVRRGDGVFINAGVLHADWSAAPGECRLHSLVFHPRLVGGGQDSIFWQKYLQPLLSDTARGSIYLDQDCAWQRQALQALERAYEAMALEPPGYEFRVREALSEMVFLLAGHAPAGQHLPKKALRSTDRIKTMLQYIQEHYAEDLTIDGIAASASISISECLRCFHDMIGTTPIQYLRQHRAQRAAELLCTTGLRVTDIAAQCGFQDSSYFARAFRQVYGCGPTEYRRSMRNESF